MPTLMDLLEGVETGAQVTRRNLEIVPLLRPDADPAPIDYILAVEALARGDLKVVELDEEGSVPELRAVSDGTGEGHNPFDPRWSLHQNAAASREPSAARTRRVKCCRCSLPSSPVQRRRRRRSVGHRVSVGAVREAHLHCA